MTREECSAVLADSINAVLKTGYVKVEDHHTLGDYSVADSMDAIEVLMTFEEKMTAALGVNVELPESVIPGEPTDSIGAIIDYAVEKYVVPT